MIHLDNIELNVSSVAADTGSAAEELRTAAVYQRKAGRRAACLLLVVVFVLAIVLLAVSDFPDVLSIDLTNSRASIDFVLIPFLLGLSHSSHLAYYSPMSFLIRIIRDLVGCLFLRAVV